MFKLGFLLGFGPLAFLIRMVVRFGVHLVTPILFIWVNAINDGSIPTSWLWALFAAIVVARWIVEQLWTFVTMYNFHQQIVEDNSGFYKFDNFVKYVGLIASDATVMALILWPSLGQSMVALLNG